MNPEAILAAIEQAKAALDEIEMSLAAEQPEEAPPAPEGGGMPGGMGGMMGKKMMEE